MPRAHRPVILPDPEMALPDEQLPPHDQIRAVSALFGGEYPSIAAMIRARQKVEFALGSEITQVQRDRCVPGSWAYFEVEVERTNPETQEIIAIKLMPVFGEIPDVEDLLKAERLGDANDRHSRLLRRRVIDAHNRGWLFGKWHSVSVPSGEWGAMHISMLEPMLHESYLAARARGWAPSS